ncbi:MAG: DUF1294 domain-containing protein [Clostridiales bacterium]|nr:DUF1294 domain-containing protein [Clostridiales bacterium]
MLLKTYLIWLGTASALCAFAFWIDKRAAPHPQRRRIPETVLLSLISFGGSIGGLWGIFCLKHKSNCRTKFHFHFIVVLSCIVQMGILILLFLRWGGAL